MPLAQLRIRRSGAELRLFDPSATRADQVMVVLWPAADVGVTTFREQRVHAAAGAQELDGAVCGRKAELRFQAAGALVQLGDGEAAHGRFDGPQDSPSLSRCADPGRKRERVFHGAQST